MIVAPLRSVRRFLGQSLISNDGVTAIGPEAAVLCSDARNPMESRVTVSANAANITRKPSSSNQRYFWILMLAIRISSFQRMNANCSSPLCSPTGQGANL